MNVEEKKPVRNPEAMWKRLGTEIVTLNRKSHQYHVLNAPAAVIFELATGENSLEVISGKLAEAFDVDMTQAMEDTRETVAGMEKLGLLARPRSVKYEKPAVREITQGDFDAAIAGGADIACRSLLGA